MTSFEIQQGKVHIMLHKSLLLQTSLKIELCEQCCHLVNSHIKCVVGVATLCMNMALVCHIHTRGGSTNKATDASITRWQHCPHYDVCYRVW